MALVKPPAAQPGNKTPSAAVTTEGICPQCGKPLHGDYTCDCPDRWENEGGTPTPDTVAMPNPPRT